MNISPSEKRAEAIARMKILKLNPGITQSFANRGTVSISKPPLGACSPAEGETIEAIREFERKFDSLVYFAIRKDDGMWKTDAFLFVSDNIGDWKYDRERLKNIDSSEWIYAYERDYNHCISSPPLHWVGLRRTFNGGLLRVW